MMYANYDEKKPLRHTIPFKLHSYSINLREMFLFIYFSKRKTRFHLASKEHRNEYGGE